MTAEQYFKWVDKHFGLGGVDNYDKHQIAKLTEFLKIIASDSFGYAEQESLIKILKKYVSFNQDTQIEIAEVIEAD